VYHPLSAQSGPTPLTHFREPVLSEYSGDASREILHEPLLKKCQLLIPGSGGGGATPLP